MPDPCARAGGTKERATVEMMRGAASSSASASRARKLTVFEVGSQHVGRGRQRHCATPIQTQLHAVNRPVLHLTAKTNRNKKNTSHCISIRYRPSYAAKNPTTATTSPNPHTAGSAVRFVYVPHGDFCVFPFHEAHESAQLLATSEVVLAARLETNGKTRTYTEERSSAENFERTVRKRSEERMPAGGGGSDSAEHMATQPTRVPPAVAPKY